MFPLLLLRGTLLTILKIIILLTIEILDLILYVHQPTRKKWHKKLEGPLQMKDENPDMFMKRMVTWGLIKYSIRKEFYESYYGLMKIGELVDSNLVVHMVEKDVINCSCSLRNLVKPGKLLFLCLGSST